MTRLSNVQLPRACAVAALVVAVFAGTSVPVQAQCWRRKEYVPYYFSPSAQSVDPSMPADGSSGIVPSPDSGPDTAAADGAAATDDLAVGAGIGDGNLASVTNVGGYIDSAIIRTRFSFQFDRTQGGNSDRAEFLYGAYIPYQQVGPSPGIGSNTGGRNGILVQDLRYAEVG